MTANVVAEAARDLLDAGWNPIVLSPRSKRPVRDGWQNERVTADVIPLTFSAESNIGVLLGEAGNGRVDVDCDCLEAVNLAPKFLPATGFIHGRASRPRSHYHFTSVPLPEHRKYEFNGCLVELRSVGQTMLPPSIHPTGEQLSWDEAEGAPATVTGELLSSAVRELAAAALIVRCYPKVGDRHGLALPLAGFLLRRQGWDEARVTKFVTAVATAAGDDEIKDRQNAVETTAQCLASDGKPTGGPELRKLIGDAAFDKFAEWLGFAKVARFTLPTIEAATVAPDEIPAWPADTLEGDFISDLTFEMYDGKGIPPQYIREEIIPILGALSDGKLGYPLHPDLSMRRFLGLISERAQSGKGESWKRLTTNQGEGGALRPLFGTLKLLHGSGVGSGQFLAKELQLNPHAIVAWDEATGFFHQISMQNSTITSVLKNLFEGNSAWTGSLTSKRRFGTDDAHLSVLLQGTKTIFVEGFATCGGAGDGLLSRFTLVHSAGQAAPPEWKPRNLAEERSLVATIANLIPKVHTVPKIAPDARECMNAFFRTIKANDHPHPDHVRRLPELVKVDILHRCAYSNSPEEITLDMAERSITWGMHQLALRLALWPPDAKSETASMVQVILCRLRKGSATTNDLRRAANVDRNGTHEIFNRCLSALTRSRKVTTVGKNSKGYEVYALDPEDSEKGTPA